jgi:hypothetical protein
VYIGGCKGKVGCEAHAGSKTRREKDQCSPHYERSRPEEDRRGSESEMGKAEERCSRKEGVCEESCPCPSHVPSDTETPIDLG